MSKQVTFYRILSVLFALMAVAFLHQIATTSGGQQLVSVLGFFWMGGRALQLANKGWRIEK